MALAAAIAGGTALAYLNGKYQLASDISSIISMKRSERNVAARVANGTICPWFLFEDTVKKYPSVRAVWTRETCYTFRELHDVACQYAHYFRSQGVQRGQLVATYLQNCADFPAIWLSLWSIGAAPAFINYNLAGAALLHCVKISGASILIVDNDPICKSRIEEERSKIENDLHITPILLDEDFKKHIDSLPKTPLDVSLRQNMSPSFPGCLFYTSGTTGLPKACAFTLERLSQLFGTRALRDSPGGPDRWYNCMPLYHGTGGINMIVCLVDGVCVALGKRFSVSSFWRDVIDSESTHFVYVGEIARYLLAAPPSPLDKAHSVRCAYGNGLRPDVWEKFRTRFNIPTIAEFFASTEGMFALFNFDRGPYQAACVGHHGLILRKLLHNVYVPVANDPVTGDILRDPKTGFATRNPYEVGGEILVAIPNEKAFQGYWDNPSATSKKFARDVFKKGDLYYRCGDSLRRTEDGHWHFLDRLGDTFRWKSENVSTAEVAAVLGEFPGVAEANVYGVTVPNHEGRAGCAALLIEPHALSSFKWDAFLRHTRERLPKYAVPVFIRLVNSSAHIHNHKQNKVGLREEGVDPSKRGTKTEGGKDDKILWLRPKNDTYEEFKDQEWESLTAGGVRL
ncbi:Isopenicillin N epimerase component [Trichophyton interdigitale]|uniref:Very long-chain fatty acid transport protein n=1 Tax=Trichophyton interdigitale TaxID=101480 RepID=A0A9P4YF29_9EURO|nr:Isopenicillin N epimerase component [Trichophyton interdigitale]KAF3899392.1 Isopenicillin N epimerase component [Trichophyton interdigitale]KAG8212212.1 Isopenicillin N epimerase component [Trichophyton interdigitale]